MSKSGFHRLALSMVRRVDDNLSIRRRILRRCKCRNTESSSSATPRSFEVQLRRGMHPPPDLHACNHIEIRMREALAAGQVKGVRQAHALQTGRPQLPGTYRATRNTDDEPARALGAGKAGIRRPCLADADPESGAQAAEREATVSLGRRNSGGIASGADC